MLAQTGQDYLNPTYSAGHWVAKDNGSYNALRIYLHPSY